jgi:predicted RNase H-like HicB family nuclease
MLADGYDGKEPEECEMNQPPLYVVSNGRLVLHLEPAEEGGYVVTSPFDPALITEAETIEEAFEMAEDAAKTLADGRAKLDRARKARKGNGKARRKAGARN